MRIVVALGGNALLKRGEPMTAAKQRENVRAAAIALAPLAAANELVLSHGNGPQVGLLALQAACYTAVEPYPLDVLDAQTLLTHAKANYHNSLYDFFISRALLENAVAADIK